MPHTGGEEAEEDEGAVPDGEEVRPARSLKTSAGRAALNTKAFILSAKTLSTRPMRRKEKADRHHEEDGDCGVEAENQMFQGEAPPFLDFDRR